jgi:GIY-YIG catalytic domain
MTGCIYSLSYETETNVFYVGSTTNPSSRLRSHRTKFGYNTMMNIIENIDELIKLEIFWNGQFKCWGFDLKNKDCHPKRLG